MATVAAAEAGTAPSQAPAVSAHKRGGRTGRMAQAEDAGLIFAFRARTAATLVVAGAILLLAPWPRSLVYVGFAPNSAVRATIARSPKRTLARPADRLP
jgi:hypothetical protein